MHWQLLILEVDSRLPNLLNFSWTSLHFPLYSRDEEEKRSTEWVKRIPEVVSALNSEVTGLAGKKPVEAIEEKVVDVKSSTTYLRPVGRNSDKPFKFIGEKEKRLDSSKNMRYSFATGELEGGQRRATDPVWSLNVFNIKWPLVNKGEPVFYNLKDGTKYGLVREELQIVSSGTELPTDGSCWFKKSSKKLSFSKGLREDVSIYRTNLKYCGQNLFSLLLSYF